MTSLPSDVFASDSGAPPARAARGEVIAGYRMSEQHTRYRFQIARLSRTRLLRR